MTLLLALVVIATIGLALLLFSKRTTQHPAQSNPPENIDMHIGRIGRLGLNRRRLGGGVSPSQLVTYDTSIGNSVDINGRADLTPRVGAKWFFVNATTGSDANTSVQAQNPATPLATVAKAKTYCTNGNGDQILVAMGLTYPRGLCFIGDMGGYSPQYPFTIQSYDPADPTNQAKWGTATGSNRPDINITGADMSGGFIQGGIVQAYRAFRGLKIDAQNTANVSLNIYTGGTSGTPDYMLWENCELPQTQLTIQGATTAIIKKVIVRNCSSHGQWGSNRAQGIFADHIDGLTVEDSAFWHNGWKEGANRTDDPTIGGSSNQSHSLYIQDSCVNTIDRRNVTIDAATEAANLKGGGIIQSHLSIRNPIFISIGGGNNITVDRPFGVYEEVSFCAAIGGNTITTGDVNWGVHASYGMQGAGNGVHHNVLARSGYTTSAYALMVDAANDVLTTNLGVPAALPTYTDFYNNVSYLWNASGSSEAVGISGGNVGLIHSNFNNNVWDDPTSGTNINVGSVALPNAYTEATLLAALGYANETAAINDWMGNPQNHGWRNGCALMMAGYAVPAQVLTDLKTNMSLTVGIPTSGQFIGVLDGSNLVAAGLPAGVTLDTDQRCWRSDGSAPAGSGNFTVTEYNGILNHTTTIPWASYARPVLTGLTVTPSGTSATIAISANVGNGNLLWMVSTKTVTPDWPHVRDGIDQDNATAAAKHGTQTVTASGAQSISVTGLPAGATLYAYVAQLDANNNPSLVSASASFVTWSPASLGANLAWWAEPKPTNLTKLGGGTPADGDQVSAITDLSGNAISLSQSTAGKYPIYHTDGAHYWLTFSGGQDLQSTSGTVAVTDASGQHSAFSTINPSSVTGTQCILDADGGSHRISQLLRTNVGTAQTIAFNTVPTPFTNSGPSVGSGTVHVLSELTSTTTTEVFVDGTGTGTTAVSGTMQSGGAKLSIGWNANGATSYYSGNWYGGFIAKGVMGSTDLASAQSYMRALAP